MKKTPTVIDVLKRMRTLLRKGWTQHAAAVTERGRVVPTVSPQAARFCLVGAEMRAAYDLGVYDLKQRTEKLIRRRIRSRSGQDGIADYNDTKGRKKSEILAVVSCAIEKAGEKK